MKRRTLLPLFLAFVTSLAAQSGSVLSVSLSPLHCTSNTLVATASNPSITVTTYSWSSMPSGAQFSNPNASLTTIGFTTAGMYTIVVVGTTSNGVASGINSVVVNNPSGISLSASAYTTCIVNNAPKFSNPIVLTAVGAAFNTWFPIGGQQPPPGTSTTVVRPSANTCYTVLGTNGNGCTVTASTCLTVVPQFSFLISPPQPTICVGDTITLSMTNIGPLSSTHGSSSSFSYSWTTLPTVNLSSPTQQVTKAFPLSTESYTAEILDSLSCISLPRVVTVSVQACITGLSHLNPSGSFHLYPQPANKELIIDRTSFVCVGWKMTNLLGTVLMEGKDIEPLESGRITLGVSDLLDGVYFLQLMGTNGSTTIRKIIVQH